MTYTKSDCPLPLLEPPRAVGRSSAPSPLRAAAPIDRSSRVNRLYPMPKHRATPSSSEQVQAGSEGGQALLEFAFVFPLLAMLVFGIIKFSIVFNNYVTLTDAVRVGARTLAVSRSIGSATQDACQLAQSSVQQAAFNLNQSLLTVPTPTVTVSCTNLTAGSQATLKATYPCDLTIIGINTAPGCTLSSQTTVRIE